MTGGDGQDGAWVILDADGRYLEASARALEILGVTLDELRSASPATFSAEPPDPDRSAAFRGAWEAAGRPGITGETTIVRPDRTRLRVRFAITSRSDDGYDAVFEPVPGSVGRPAEVRTVGDVIAAWRTAERRLEALEPGTTEWLEAQEEVAWLRDRHAAAFSERLGEV
jgi:PAS domain-containing protein